MKQDELPSTPRERAVAGALLVVALVAVVAAVALEDPYRWWSYAAGLALMLVGAWAWLMLLTRGPKNRPQDAKEASTAQRKRRVAWVVIVGVNVALIASALIVEVARWPGQVVGGVLLVGLIAGTLIGRRR